MSQSQLNIDCGCTIFQHLTIPEAIILSRTAHFWYEISGRRAAYTRMKFPSFADEFDILEYRNWQEYGRQKFTLSSSQLIQYSTSRVIRNGIQDLEVILDGYFFNSQNYAPASSRVRSEAEQLLIAISRFQSIVALTLTIEGRTDPDQISAHNVKEDQSMRELPQKLVTRLITHLASKLISFELHRPGHYADGLDFASCLLHLHPTLTMPNLLHARLPLRIDHEKAPHRYPMWESLKPFQSRGVLEISSLASYVDGGFLPARYWDTIHLDLEKLFDPPPQHLIFTPPQVYQVDHSHVNRSLNILLPLPAHSLASIENYLNELIPDGSNYQEIGLFHDADGVDSDLDFTPLRRVAHSLRSLNLGVNKYPGMNFQDLMASLYEGVVSNQCNSSEVSSLIHVHRIKIVHPHYSNLWDGNEPLDIDLVDEVCPNVTHLELCGSICINFLSFARPSFHQLHHLVVPLGWKDSANVRNHEYLMNIVTRLRQLESLHFTLDSPPTQLIRDQDHFLHALVWSSQNLVEVIFSCNSPSSSRDWVLPHDRFELKYLNEWLIQLHLIWQIIQPTHPIPIFSPVTQANRIDLVPLLTTFLRYPIQQLPYLRHHCQLFDACYSRRLPPKPFFSTRLPTAITETFRQWFESETDRMARLQKEEDLLKRKRLELSDRLSGRSHALRQHLTQSTQQTGASEGAQRQKLDIETRPHFRMILELDRAEEIDFMDPN